MQCDVCVIGAGPGGYVAAIRAAQRGAKVVCIERAELGGVCLNWGCIPTKTLIHTGELYRHLQHAEAIGLEIGGLSLNLEKLKKRKNTVIGANKGGIKALFKAHGIEHVIGDAKVTAPGRVAVGDAVIEAGAVIVATGSSPAQLPGLEMDGTVVISSTEALELTTVPKRVAVIGAGALGAEFACLWNAFGAEVTLIEMMPTVLPLEDEEIGTAVGKLWKKAGIDVRTGTKVANLSKTAKKATLTLEGDQAGTVEVDLVLVGIGRRYHNEAVAGLPGIELGPRGQVLVDEHMETSVAGVYAIGDVTGKTMLAHGASAEGITAAVNATGGRKRMDYRVVPACTFTHPEVASVGMTEKQAMEAGHEVRVGRFQFLASGRAHAMNATDGMVKIVGDAQTDEILGVHIMGAEAGELIATAALAMKLEATVEDIAHTIHTHPTLAETLLEAAEDLHGMGIHTPPRRKRAKG